MDGERCGNRNAGDTALVARIRDLCTWMDAHPAADLTLAALAARAGLSPGYLQRSFRRLVGVTPRRYAEACRQRDLRLALRRGDSVTGAIFAAGYGSTSRVYERVSGRMGMTPGQYRNGGAALTISWASAATPLGRLLVAATDRGLCRVELGDDEAALWTRLSAEFPSAAITPMPAGSDPVFDGWMQALRAALVGGPPATGLPLDVRGTAFQIRVWDFLRQIPQGETRSYAEVAAEIGRPRAARAVAGACAANRVALAIPCHRVIRGDGAPGGYRWGTARKRALLARERGAAADNLLE